MPRNRLDPAIFRLPEVRIRDGYYSDAYFNFTKELLEAEEHRPRVLMQVFQKHESLLGGIDEAIAILKRCSGCYRDGQWRPGWGAHEAGAIGVSTDANASWWGGRGVGTVPHALIAAYDGDTVAAARAFAARYARTMNVTVLVDFENDSTRTAIEVADALEDDL